MQSFSYQRATSAEAAVQAAGRSRAPATQAPTQYLAGGTTLLDLMKTGAMAPTRLVDINDLAARHGQITDGADGLKLGALVRMADAAAHPAVRRDYPVVADALALAASQQLRNMASLGGNVLQRTRCRYFRDPSWPACNKRDPGSGCGAIDGVNRLHAVLGVSDACIAGYPGDFGQALAALDATVEVLGPAGPRVIAFDELHVGPDATPHIETQLAAGELITGFSIPAGPWTRRSLYVKVRDRESYEFALASAAVALDIEAGAARTVRIALGGVSSRPWRAREAEAALVGKPVTDPTAWSAAEIAFVGAVSHGGNDFKPELGRRTLVRALLQAARMDVSTMAERAQPAPLAQATRVDGPLKVAGEARYGADFPEGPAAYAVLVTSPIGRGRITAIDDADARTTPGLLDILTWREAAGQVKPGAMFADKGYMGSSIAPLASPEIRHAGQIVAVVTAETLEGAQDAAARLKVRYAPATVTAGFDSPGAVAVDVKSVSPSHEDPAVGDAATAFAAAPVKVDEHYSTPTQHHNPMELFTTACAWQNGKLTVWELSQGVWGAKNGLAEQLGLSPDDVHVVSPYIGGAFGSRGALTQRTALVALAAKRVNRPVKLATTRAQGFTIATYRAETRHRVRLGATSDGKLTALIHEGWEVTSRPDNYNVSGTDASTRLYACPNVASTVRIVHADRNTPGFMRAPPETPYLFALESAMDELAYALRLDPVELRRLNDTQEEPIRGLPYTSRHLVACFDAAAAAFGWASRTAQPGSMRDGDWLIGWGCASTMYPTQMGPASARVSLTGNGAARVQCASQEIGNGVRTVLALTAARSLGVTLERIDVEVGDSDLPPAPVSGGSNSTASCCTVVAKACDDIRGQIARAAVAAADGPFAGRDPATLRLADGALVGADGAREPLAAALARTGEGAIEAYAENTPHGVPPDASQGLYRGKAALAGGAKMKDRIQFAFGAQFIEVRVHSLTGEVRAPRAVGAFAAGTIVNPITARSQLMGGMIWGISAALHEATEIDPRFARYYNDDLSEYLVPVNADIGEVDVILVPETDDAVNPLGIKGIGELGNVGMNAATANAVFHATGLRVRDLPVRIDQLLAAPALGRGA